MKKHNARTLILNADYVPISLKSWQQAFTLLVKGKAQQVDFYPNDHIRDGKGKMYPIPAVVVLNEYVRRNYQKAPFSKLNVFLRDSYTCQYCTRKLKSNELTLDHVVPRSKWNEKGSPTIWTNIVTACIKCNSEKADMSCKDAGMYPIKKPVQPSYDEIFCGLYFSSRVEKEWLQWLSVFPSFKAEAVNA